MDNNSSYLTSERYEELKKELDDLKTAGRQKVAKRLRQAKELGDLSENVEYQEAREEQRRIEQRIGQLEEIVRNAVIIKKSDKPQTVRIGSVVKVKKAGGAEVNAFSIVGSNEAQPFEGRISNESPIGRGLLGRKVGETVRIKTPNGEVEYHILDIE
jgi:transcription elongation factor GreA